MSLGTPSPPDALAPAPARSRLQAVITVVLLVAAAGLGYLLLEVRANSGRLEALAAAACRGDRGAAAELRAYLHAVLAVVPLSAVATAAYVGRVGVRARREGLFPPAGMWMLRRPARTFAGPAARRIALLLFAFAAALVGLAAVLSLIGVRMLVLLDR